MLTTMVNASALQSLERILHQFPQASLRLREGGRFGRDFWRELIVGFARLGERLVERERMIRQASNAAQIAVVAASGVISSVLLFLMTDGLFGDRRLAFAVAGLSAIIYFSPALLELGFWVRDRALRYWASRRR